MSDTFSLSPVAICATIDTLKHIGQVSTSNVFPLIQSLSNHSLPEYTSLLMHADQQSAELQASNLHAVRTDIDHAQLPAWMNERVNEMPMIGICYASRAANGCGIGIPTFAGEVRNDYLSL
jgi:hypothetical protein